MYFLKPGNASLFVSVHEGTLVHALSVFKLWCEKFLTEVPSKIVQWFKVKNLIVLVYGNRHVMGNVAYAPIGYTDGRVV